MQKRTAVYRVILRSEWGLQYYKYCYSNAELLENLKTGFSGKVLDIFRLYYSGGKKNVTGTYFRQIMEHNRNRENLQVK